MLLFEEVKLLPIMRAFFWQVYSRWFLVSGHRVWFLGSLLDFIGLGFGYDVLGWGRGLIWRLTWNVDTTIDPVLMYEGSDSPLYYDVMKTGIEIWINNLENWCCFPKCFNQSYIKEHNSQTHRPLYMEFISTINHWVVGSIPTGVTS